MFYDGGIELGLGKNQRKNGSQAGVMGDNKSQAEKVRREKERYGYNKYVIEK